jgi:hypothetical protein
MLPWGPLELDVGQRVLLCLGPLRLSLQRDPGALRLLVDRQGDPHQSTRRFQPQDRPLPREARRIVLPGDSPLRLVPATADRAVVARPDHEVSLPPGGSLEVFVATPLWLQIWQDKTLLSDLPIARPVSTWFGPTPMDGELAYASTTSLRTQASALLDLAHRAATRVLVRNGASDVLQLERLYLPVRQLAIFAGQDGRPWTEALTLDRVEVDSAVLERVPEVGRAPLAAPRDVPGAPALMRAFNAFVPRSS